MSDQQTPKKGSTPPKGRPTRSRDGYYGPSRVFGPRLQWIAVVLVIVVLFLVLAIVTNPFDGNGGGHGSGPAPLVGSILTF